MGRIQVEFNLKVLQYLKDFAQSITGFLTDDIKPDGEQIDAFIDTEAAKPETKHLVVREFGGGNLAKAGLNADLIAFFIEAAEIGWDAIVNQSEAMALGVLTEELENVTIITLPSGRVGTFTRVAA